MVAAENAVGGRVRTMTEPDWTLLMGKLKRGACTPFLGAGVYWDRYSIRSKVARKWADEYHYPLSDSSDLASVAQFVATETDPDTVQSLFIEELKLLDAPDFADQADPYTILASLPLPIYITTNYDNFMTEALKRKNRDPRTELCKWKTLLDDEKSYLADLDYSPTVANPSVFHLHGRVERPDSLVLIEDDYFEFLINISRDLMIRVPHQIQKAMSKSLLLVGYRLFDWDFRVLFHLLASCITLDPRIAHVAVQIAPAEHEDNQDVVEKVQDYFDRYFKSRRLNICISFLKTQDFAAELKTRWEAANANG
jgi:hypothetical protein